jgi:arsenical pump membrane protein
VPEALALVLALLALAGTLAAAVVRSRWPIEAIAAVGCAAALVAVGALSVSDARDAIGDLGPTVGFLAALLMLADGCRREGLFDAMGGLMASGAAGSPRRLLALVFAVAGATTAVLSLDATVVLLTPIVFATAARLRTSPRPHVYACSHLANSASLLLPVSNLTNLLAFHASGLSFTRFAGLMALPTAGAVAVEWVVLTRFFAVDLDRPRPARTDPGERPRLPRFAVAVVAR